MARLVQSSRLSWGRLWCCLLPVLTHCGGRSALLLEDDTFGGTAGSQPGTGGGDNRGGANASAGTGGTTPGTGGFGLGGTSSAGFGGGALGGAGGSAGGVFAGAAGASAGCPLRCDNNRECVRSNERAYCHCGPGLFGDQCETVTESIAIGTNHACLLRSDGQVECWGKNLVGEATSPPGADFSAIDAQGTHNCGVLSGQIQCWGTGARPRHMQPMAAVAVANDFMCGIFGSGEVQCFTSDDASYFPGIADARQLVAGDDFACALRANGFVSCWGENSAVLNVPNVPFEAVSAGATYVCGIMSNQQLACWGDPFLPATRPPAMEASAIAAGRAHACAIRWDESLQCWGDDDYGQASPPKGQFVSVFAGGNLSCAIDVDYGVHCWGGDTNAGPAPGGHFIAVSAGDEYGCAIAIDGTVTCFGNGLSAGVIAPEGRFSSLEMRRQACGIQQNGELRCWRHDLVEPTPPSGSFVAVSTGIYESCAIRESGELACWGRNYIASPPAGSFSHVSVGTAHACAIQRDDHQGVCWGRDDLNGIPVTLGYASAIASGDSHTCTLDERGSPRCWGNVVSMPSASFRMISAGMGYSTGVTSEGRLVSWSRDAEIRPLPDGNDFVSVSSWSGFGCALRENGTIGCWGTLSR
jgi:alpha-tubulin suppressor-like RCC1 family protein